MSRCAAIKPNGERCKVEAIPDSEWCWSHDPDYEQARRRRASKAGKRGGRGRPQAEIASIKEEIRAVIGGVLSGRVERSSGAVVFQGYNTLLKAHATELAIRERLELIER